MAPDADTRNERVAPLPCPECESPISLNVLLTADDCDALVGSWEWGGKTVYVVDTDHATQDAWQNAELELACQNDECDWSSILPIDSWEHGQPPATPLQQAIAMIDGEGD